MMRKQFVNRLLSISLVTLLTLSSTSCAANDSFSDSSTDALPSTATVNDDDPLTPYEEPVRISWAVQSAAVQQFFDGDTYEVNRWSRLIKEKLNIDLDVMFSADISTDAYRNKMSVLLSSGEFPDVLRYSDRTFYQQAVDAGYLADITDVFAQYASDNVKAYQKAYPDSFDGAKIDGRLYAFPAMNDNFHQAANLWIRDDWLENTSSNPPKTVDEMVALAKKFTFEDPDGNGKDDTYGFALAKNVVQSNYGTLLGLIGAYGVPGYGSTGVFYRDDAGKMTFAYLHPNMKQALELVHGMYKEGLIDPEFVVKDVASMETDITNGSIGMMYHMNWGTWHPFNYIYQNEGVITRPYPIPTIEGIAPKMGIESNRTGDLFMISSQCKNPEALIKILNLYEQTCISSEDPKDFADYWANEQYRLCPIYIAIPTELFAPQIHTALEKGSSDALNGTALEYYNYVTGFEDGSLADDTNAYGTWGQMFKNGSMAIDLRAQTNGELVTNVMANDIPEIWKQNSAVLGTMVETAFTDIIIGNKPVDYFDTFVQEWLNAGGQQTLDELEQLYPIS